MEVRKAYTGTSEGLSYFICCASSLLVLYSIRPNLFTFTSPFCECDHVAGSQEGVVGSLRL